MTTFFTKVKQFPDVPEDEKITLDPFLEAAEGATTIFDLLGVAFKPVKSDITGNISKLRKRQAEDKDKFPTLNAILQDEKDNKTSKEGQIGALWLNRALFFIQQLLVHLIDSLRKEPDETKFRPIILKAYEETLKPFHGMIVKAVFSTVSRAAPYRPDLMKLLALNEEGKDEQVIADMESYLINLKKNNDAVIKIIKDLGLYADVKV
ncbi:glycolipid transfer protein-like [Mytilus trossulus]|uniref:glycolipid transfer protein-like n=1 Tax=Mytilus trossulus TaxID=6551 RepID=UPI0030078A82